MAISKSSKRLQITLNGDKEKEKVILDYLSSCIDENSKVKEILYNFIVSQSEYNDLKVTHFEVPHNKISEEKLLTSTQSEKDIKKNKSDFSLNLDNISDEEVNISFGAKQDEDADKNAIEFLLNNYNV